MPTMQAAVPLDVDKLRELRIAAELSMAKAAEKAGLGTRQRWQAIESGGATNINLATLEAIARAVGAKPAELLKPAAG